MLFNKNSEVVRYDIVIKCVKNLNGLNSLYLVFNNLDAYIKCNDSNDLFEDKYLFLDSTEINKTFLGKYEEIWNEIKEQIEKIKDYKVEYGKNIMKIRFEADDKLPLNKIINVSVCVLIISSIFKENNKYYPHILLHYCSYEYDEHNNYYPQILINHCSCKCRV